MDAQQVINAVSRVSAPKLSVESGVSVKTIYRIRNSISSPNMRTVRALAAGLLKMGVGLDGHVDSSASLPSSEVVVG